MAKDLKEKIHVRKYIETQWRQAAQAQAREVAEVAERHAHARARAAHLTQAFREKRNDTTRKMEQGRISWRANRRKDQQRERTELTFELTMRERRRLVAQHARNSAREELETGVQNFDRNMKRLGIAAASSSGMGDALDMKTMQCPQAEFLLKLRASVPTSAMVCSIDEYR